VRAVLVPVIFCLAVLQPGAGAAQQFAPPAAAVPLASPAGAAQLGILVNWNEDTTPIYGFAFRSRGAASPAHLQLVFGQARGFGGNWIGGLSYDRGVRLVGVGTTAVTAIAAGQMIFDRRENALHLRVPIGVRAETTVAAGPLWITPVVAGGGSGGVTRFGGWEEYGGAFGEGGLRLELLGGWAQGTVLFEERLVGGTARTVEPRLVLRFGYEPRPRGR
jgi:hypothetical protein